MSTKRYRLPRPRRWVLTIGAMLVLLAVTAAPAVAEVARFDDGHMDGWGWLVALAMVAMMGGMGWMMFSMMRGTGHQAHSPEDPVEVLKTRLAHGELTVEEFQERLRAIEDAQR